MRIPAAIKANDVSLLGELLPTQQDIDRMKSRGSVANDGPPQTVESLRNAISEDIRSIHAHLSDRKLNTDGVVVKFYGLFNVFGPWKEYNGAAFREIGTGPSMYRIDVVGGTERLSVLYRLMRSNERVLLSSPLFICLFTDEDWSFMLRWKVNFGDAAADNDRAMKIVVGMDAKLTQELFGYWLPGDGEGVRVFSRDNGRRFVLHVTGTKVDKAEVITPKAP